MSDVEKRYKGDEVAELIASGEYERAVEAAGSRWHGGIIADQLPYADPVNHDRVFAGLPIALGALQEDDLPQDDDVELYASEWSREND